MYYVCGSSSDPFEHRSTLSFQHLSLFCWFRKLIPLCLSVAQERSCQQLQFVIRVEVRWRPIGTWIFKMKLFFWISVRFLCNMWTRTNFFQTTRTHMWVLTYIWCKIYFKTYPPCFQNFEDSIMGTYLIKRNELPKPRYIIGVDKMFRCIATSTRSSIFCYSDFNFSVVLTNIGQHRNGLSPICLHFQFFLAQGTF